MMQKNYRLLMTRTVLLLILGLALSACGGDSSEDGASDTSDTNIESNREGYEWRRSRTTLEVSPDSDPSVNGNMEIDPAEVDVQFTTVFTVRPDNDSLEDEELPVLDGKVRIGLGEAGASRDEDFEWIELTHQGEGVYAGSARGVADVYRATAEAPGLKPASNTTNSASIARIISPVQGESYPRRKKLSISFEPIEAKVRAEALLNGRMLSGANTASEKEELSISAAWLQETANDQAIGLKRRNGSVSLGSGGESYVEFIVLREVNVNIQ